MMDDETLKTNTKAYHLPSSIVATKVVLFITQLNKHKIIEISCGWEINL